MRAEPKYWYGEPGWAASLLAPISHAYGAIAARRIARATPYRSKLPVICVGNFTAGGSGKTPFAILLANTLLARGEKPVVLTRGYGGSERGPHWVTSEDGSTRVGDEPLLLARICPVMVARDRSIGAKAIEASNRATVILMDDGLQNPGLAKSLSFAVVDGTRGLGNGHVIPAGPLRMPLDAQAPLVQAIVFNGPASPALAADLARNVSVPQLAATLEGDRLPPGRYVAFAGIGHPERFFETARALGATLAAVAPFPDHARLTSADALRLLELARLHEAQLITTEKDFVRLTGNAALRELAAETLSVPVRMALAPGANAALTGLLDAALGNSTQPTHLPS